MTSRFVEVDGTRLHYLESGVGIPALFLHGWPTSSFLWRNVLGELGGNCRAIAPDLPGFGQSDKPLTVRYDFPYFTRILDGFVTALAVETLDLVVHDLGGPVGLYWASRHPGRLRRLVLLNTLLYPEPSWAVVAFVVACRTPGLRALLASPWGLRFAMRIGVNDRTCLTEDVLRGVLAPFERPEARRALLKAGSELHPKGMREIARFLPSLRIPVRAIYGERDRILPDVARTMRRLARELPQAEVTALPDCGHFLQEDRPAELARLLAEFLARAE